MSHTARVGLLMVIALVVLGVFIIKIEEIPIGTKGGRVRVQAVFPSVAGLDEKAAVRVAGVRVGIVESIALHGDRAFVTLALERGVVLHQGAHAEVTSLGMLGDKYIELYPGQLEGPLLAAGTVLDGTSPVAFDRILKTGNDIAGDVKAVTESLRKSLGGTEGERRLDEIIENIRQLTASVRDLVAANRNQVDATLANFRAFSETLKSELPKLAEKLNHLADNVDGAVSENRGTVNETIVNLRDLSGKLRASADNLNLITGKIAKGEGSIGKLINDETTVDNLNATLKSVESGVASLKNTIGRAERWGLQVNLRSETLPSLNRNNNSRSVVGIDLETTKERFYRLELVDSPFGHTSSGTNTVATTFPDGHTETTVTTNNQTTDATNLNLQVGWHLRDFTLRTGLFESHFGLGIDKEFLKNKLRLTLEAYDLARDQKAPHLRFEGRYYLTRNLFAYSGWDDPTFHSHSSVLFGAGLTWGDDDLKYLFGSAGAISGR
jgi:phospholipid/cholesterol/gamma-HCH transport system substrate-binding protein